MLNYQNKLTVFSRSVTKASHLYWAQEVNGNWSGWALIGGSSVSLKSDVAVALNGFSKVHNIHVTTLVVQELLKAGSCTTFMWSFLYYFLFISGNGIYFSVSSIWKHLLSWKITRCTGLGKQVII